MTSQVGSEAPSGARPAWVGLIELGDGLSVQGAVRAPTPEDRLARVWARLHGVVLGSVEVPVVEGSIPPGALTLALERDLAVPVRRHLEAEGVGVDGGSPIAAALASSRACDLRDRAWDEAISVVVATKDRSELIGATLASLKGLGYREFEVLMVDGSRDQSTRRVFESVVGEDPRFRYVPEPPTGLSMARNRGMAEARYDYCAFTDDDCVVDALWLDGIARGFGRDPGVACVTGIVPSARLETLSQQYFDGRVWWSHSVEPRLYSAGRGPDDSPLHPFRAGIFGTGANFALDRRVAGELGGFSRLLGVGSLCRGGGEDGDMFVRVLRSGRLLAYEPSALVWHEHRGSLEELTAQLTEYGRGIAIVGLKWLADPGTRGDVLRRVPGAVLYYARLLFQRGYAGDSTRAPMALAEAKGVLGGPLAFARGYRALRRLEAGSTGPGRAGPWIAGAGARRR